MSSIVFSGAAQCASPAVLGGGGRAAAGRGAAARVASRSLAIGVGIGPSMRGGPVRRALEGQAVVDASLSLGKIGDGRYGPRRLIGSTAPQYAGWTLGTLAGVLLGNQIADPKALGLDALFPAFFLVLVVAELTDRASRVTAAVGGLIALALIPVAPPGIPVIVACVAVLAGRLAGRT